MSDQLLEIIKYSQIVISIVIVVLVLIQNRSDGLGSMFGGGGGEVFRTKRGLEKVVYRATLVLAIVLAVLSTLLVKYSGV